MINVIVFDFDGTLVQSNELKYNAFFELFPADEEHSTLIRDVLGMHLEASRYVILNEILKAQGIQEDTRKVQVELLATRYNEIVLAGAKTCPPCPEARQTLQRLQPSYALYLSSTTPEEALREIVEFRNWTQYFQAVFGYPRKKIDTLRHILHKEQVTPAQVVVVGDGASDNNSAREIGCSFFDVKKNSLFHFENWIQNIL